MTNINRGVLMVALIAVGWLVSDVAAATEPVGAERIVIKDFMFSPMTLTTKAGVEVTWTNQDDEPHTVVSDTGLFRSGALDTGNSYSFKFDKPGTYHVFCSMHPQMIATVVVQ